MKTLHQDGYTTVLVIKTTRYFDLQSQLEKYCQNQANATGQDHFSSYLLHYSQRKSRINS